MVIKNLTYLFLQLIYLVIPVILSFKINLRFSFRLRYLLPAVIFSGAIFVMWNMRFDELGIWNYNSDYVTGIYLLNVPVEEWLSFLLIPVSGAYIFDWMKIRLEKFKKQNIFVTISLMLFLGMGILAYFFRRNMFSFFTFFLTAIYLGYTVFRNRFKKNYAVFYATFGITLLPFLVVSIVSGILPILSYSANHIMGIALFAIPIERLFYLFLMLLISITIYEYLAERRYY